jgi:predicted ATPase
MRDPAQLIVDIARGTGLPFMMAIGLARLGRVQVEEGETDTGIATIIEGLSNCQQVTSNVSYEYYACLLAEAYLMASRREEGLALLAEIIPMAAGHHQRLYEPELHRLRGELLLLKGERGEAETEIRQAVAVARELEARSWELRATTSLARLLRDTGRGSQAHAMLAEIYNWFTEGFDTADLKDAEAMLDELGCNEPVHCRLIDSEIGKSGDPEYKVKGSS